MRCNDYDHGGATSSIETVHGGGMVEGDGLSSHGRNIPSYDTFRLRWEMEYG